MVDNKPIKKFRSGSIEGVIWLNKRKKGDGSEIEFKTVTLRRSWLDKDQEIWRDEKINLRRNDLVKMNIIINKLQEELFLTKGEAE